ncbi:LysM peptidoglycan-binding domain-containing protein [Dysgonomonas sp. OttesenSCG-928-M03]|nr:LysM peptidoglycan-binding domain-containing protein [Dysgonomonas sp. OttesenSCG-928-M03]
MNFKYFKTIAATGCLILASTFASFGVFNNNTINEVVYQTNKPGSHTVAKGETVYSIARLYNVAVSDIYSANPKALDGIKAGDLLTIPVATNARQYPANATKTYTVKSKETLYSIAKKYGVKVEDIIDANPELKAKPLTDGQILRIPSSSATKIQNRSNVAISQVSKPKSQFISHKVAPKETLYGISKQYGVTTEAIIDFNPDIKDGLKDGATIIIPVLEATSGKATLLDDINKISIGVVLPFVNKSDGQRARFVEYYEGFLLALSEMKAKGLSANVYTFDMGSETGTDKLKSLLDTYEMKYLDLIIGGVSPQQVTTISDFAKKQGIKYVIPFPTKADNVTTNPQIFQVNAPHSTLYANVAKTFVNLFTNANVIYITENGMKGDRADFIEALNTQLPRAGIIANTINANQNLKSTLAGALDQGRKNVIVPTSASSKMLRTVLAALSSITEESPNISLSLFGHTDWQTYGQYIKDYKKYDTYIYTPFYLNDDDSRMQRFVSNYKKWYGNKSLINTYPKYGVLGYDTGISFLTALQKYGKNFDNNTNSLAVSSLQTPFLFKKDNPLGGFMNTGFYLVHYKSDGSIVKTEYGR